MAIVPKAAPNPIVSTGRTAVKAVRLTATSDPTLIAKAVNDTNTAVKTAVNKLSASITKQAADAAANPVIPTDLTLATLNVTGSATINDATLTGTAVIPYYQGVAQAFGEIDCTGPSVESGALNAASVAKNSTGSYTVTFATSVAGAHPVALATVAASGSPAFAQTSISTLVVNVFIFDNTGAPYDPGFFYFVVF